jgi:hypothetical protein
MSEIILGGIFTVAGILIGGLLQYVYSNKVNQSEFKRNSEYQAYLEFVEAVSSIKTAQKRKSTKDLSAYQKKLIDAKI